jgi:predicted amidohydrolase YtcJ
MNKLIRNTAMTVALFAIVGAIAISDAQQAAPALILSNGKVITVDQRFTIAEAVAIKNDRVIGVGSNQEILRLAGSGTRKIDLKGKSVIPGLIDNPMHPSEQAKL